MEEYIFNGVLIAVAVGLWILFIFYLLFKAIDCAGYYRKKEAMFWGAICFFLLVVPLGAGLGLVYSYNKKHPCLETAIEMRYNPATKTVMPMSVCVRRGTWIEE